ncbi:tol-pal system protein YbgF [Candidatus Magnetomonas plexicatena]|uniref:tol-pal system protein YbgF n=1 Tax=Candidatus Magnetomonas plexicatena TaxID=2552947 RepID=UPI001C77DC62|nr:tol-pal system protein YbgF [Nitrospirales bacterium LBB_01]
MRLKFLKVCAVVSLAALCACAQDGEYSTMKNEIIELRKVQLGQKQEITEIQKRLSMTDTSKTGAKTDVLSAIRENQETLNSKVVHLTRELQQLSGRFDERKYYDDRMFAETKTDRDVLKAQLEALENEIKVIQGKPVTAPQQKSPQVAQTQVAQTPPPAQLKPQETPPPQQQQQVAAKPEDTADTKTLYEDAYKDLLSGKPKEARDKFNRVIKDFPASPFVPNCHFWIADSYFKEGNYEDAILGFDVVIKKYPSSTKVPGAKLKQAMAFNELKDTKTAKTILHQLIEEHPQSKEAEQAKQLLEKIGGTDTSKTDVKKLPAKIDKKTDKKKLTTDTQKTKKKTTTDVKKKTDDE